MENQENSLINTDKMIFDEYIFVWLETPSNINSHPQKTPLL